MADVAPPPAEASQVNVPATPHDDAEKSEDEESYEEYSTSEEEEDEESAAEKKTVLENGPITKTDTTKGEIPAVATASEAAPGPAQEVFSSVPPERFNPSPNAHAVKGSASEQPQAQSSAATTPAATAEESSEEEETSSDEEESSDEELESKEVAVSTKVEKSETQQISAQPERTFDDFERFNPAPFLPESLLPPSANVAASTATAPVKTDEESSEEESSEEESEESEEEEISIVVTKSTTEAKEGAAQQSLKNVEQTIETQDSANAKTFSDFERFNPAPLLLEAILPPSANVTVTQTKTPALKEEGSSEEEESSEEESSDEEESSEEEIEAVSKPAAVVSAGKISERTVDEPERFNPSPFIKDRILEIQPSAQTTIDAVHHAVEEPERFNPSPFIPTSIFKLEKSAAVKKTEIVKEIYSDEEESESEYESSEEETDNEESSEEEVTIIPSKHVTTVKEAEGETVKFLSPVRIVNVTDAECQPERFNPSPYIESHILTTKDASGQQKNNKASLVSSQPERFNPSPCLEDRITTTQSAILDVNFVPERFNPAPFVESKIIATNKVEPVQPKTVEPVQQEKKLIQAVTVTAVESFKPTVTDAVVKPVPEITVVKQVTFEAAASPVSEPEPRGAYEKLKVLLESGKQMEEENVPLFDELKPNVPPASTQQTEASVNEAPLPPEEERSSVRSRGPRTAAEYMEEARRIADDQSISLYSPSVLVVKHLVSQQQKLHDMLDDMRRQCNNVDTQVKTIRAERLVPRTYLKKKHPWSHLIR